MKCGFHCCRVIDSLSAFFFPPNVLGSFDLNTGASFSQQQHRSHDDEVWGNYSSSSAVFFFFFWPCLYERLWAWEVKLDPPLRLTPQDVVSTEVSSNMDKIIRTKTIVKTWNKVKSCLTFVLSLNLNHKIWMKVLFPFWTAGNFSMNTYNLTTTDDP